METQTRRLTLSSSMFTEGQTLPEVMIYNEMGCNGGNTSPDLQWGDVPEGTKSFAITCYDPDAPTGTGFYHWVMFDIGTDRLALQPGGGSRGHEPHGSKLGITDYGSHGYGGPCPPPGDAPHHYHFDVFALDVEKLGADEKTTGAKLHFLMRGHILAQGRLTGLFGQ
jgi:Raf kinase inhibitor-like YbhB/YbcL family protein